jgi:hypothetical protein
LQSLPLPSGEQSSGLQFSGLQLSPDLHTLPAGSHFLTIFFVGVCAAPAQSSDAGARIPIARMPKTKRMSISDPMSGVEFLKKELPQEKA